MRVRVGVQIAPFIRCSRCPPCSSPCRGIRYRPHVPSARCSRILTNINMINNISNSHSHIALVHGVMTSLLDRYGP